jgi:nucleoside-diphosphate-sugar epimerase
MKILVTGAAGHLGSATCRVLAAAGHEVIGYDRVPRADLPIDLKIVDLRVRDAVYDHLPPRLDAAIHLGNHINFDPPDPQMIFNENMAMNMNVFQAAVDRGAGKLIFASSIQVHFSVPRLTKDKAEPLPPYLPMDEQTPAAPTNPYALSKEAGEVMLRYYTRVYGTQTIAVRWPWMFDLARRDELMRDWPSRRPWLPSLGFAYLSFDEASRLVEAILTADLPGFRTYFPARRDNVLGLPTSRVLHDYFPAVPLRKPLADGDGLLDLSRIERDTGWRPDL